MHLNTANENIEVDKKKLRDSHVEEIKAIQSDADSKINTLQREIEAKESALQHLAARSIAIEKDSQQRLIIARNEATAREIELQAQHEEELKSRVEELSTELSSKTTYISDLLIKLENASQRHRLDIVNIQEQLKEENRLGLKRLREELSNSHSQEIRCLNSQHDKTTAKFKADASDHEKIAVENAITMVRAENDQQIRQLLNQHKEELKVIQTEANEKMNAEIRILQSEVFEARVIAQEVPGLKARINEHKYNEITLQSEVRRLQESLDLSSSSNQRTIDELTRENEQLRYEIREVKQALNDGVKQVRNYRR